MFEKFMEKFTKPRDNGDEMEFKPFEPVEEATVTASTYASQQVNESSASASADSVELKVIRPESYAEVSSVADHLLAGCTVVLNIEVLDQAQILRMLDFLNGVTYCTEGEIKRVSQTTFIITPHSNIDISDM